ncbi:hypothetical protein Ahy_A05g023080 [Arachis hypogaea]|uniref:Peptidase A1 domain-containing protein n=1 Tax=Arachis hypogaea TaxID=3818 RepID=A0A445D2B5_ARAHY|nr:hypothetical protein Ahy_A05g023080 [Arachis hypogaea]
MALNLKPSFLLLTLAFSLTIFSFVPTPTCSRASPSEFATTVLDLSASLHQAQQVLSLNPQLLETSLQQEQEAQINPTSTSSSQFSVSYGDGSFTVGEYMTETVSFGNSGSVAKVAMGCGHDNEGLFVAAAGLIGLGGGPLSLTSQIKATSFSYCLVDRDSPKSSTLEFNSPRPADSVTGALLRNQKLDTFYYVQLAGVSVGGHMISVPPETFAVGQSGSGGIIVDCGTAVTRLQTQAYNSVRDAFRSMTRNLRTTNGFAIFDTCYDLSSLQSVDVPTVSFHFGGGKSWLLPAKNYLIPVDESGTYCFAFAPTTSSMSIMGNIQQQGTRVSFDLAHNLVGFSPNKC